VPSIIGRLLNGRLTIGNPGVSGRMRYARSYTLLALVATWPGSGKIQRRGAVALFEPGRALAAQQKNPPNVAPFEKWGSIWIISVMYYRPGKAVDPGWGAGGRLDEPQFEIVGAAKPVWRPPSVQGEAQLSKGFERPRNLYKDAGRF